MILKMFCQLGLCQKRRNNKVERLLSNTVYHFVSGSVLTIYILQGFDNGVALTVERNHFMDHADIDHSDDDIGPSGQTAAWL